MNLTISIFVTCFVFVSSGCAQGHRRLRFADIDQFDRGLNYLGAADDASEHWVVLSDDKLFVVQSAADGLVTIIAQHRLSTVHIEHVDGKSVARYNFSMTIGNSSEINHFTVKVVLKNHVRAAEFLPNWRF